MIKWAGWLIVVFPGLGHSVGALVETAPNHADAWFGGEGWTGDANAMNHAEATLWYTVFSFGLPFLLVGLLVLWMDRRAITPPPFFAWGIAAWAAVATAAGGPSPLLVLFVAAGLLLVAARRAGRTQPPSTRARAVGPRPGAKPSPGQTGHAASRVGRIRAQRDDPGVDSTAEDP